MNFLYIFTNSKKVQTLSLLYIAESQFCYTQKMSSLNFDKVISYQDNKLTVHTFQSEDGRYYRKKIIKFKNKYEMKWNYQNFKKTSLTESSSQLMNQLSFTRVQMRQLKGEIQILVPYIHSVSSLRRLKELASNFSKMTQKTLKNYCFDLIQKLINDGYRAFLPTFDNILLTERSIFLNNISIVGLPLLQFKQAISNSDFIQICAFLPSTAFDDKKLEIDYVILKQMAVLLFVLTFIFSKNMMFVLSKQIGQTVTFQEAKKYVKVQKQRIKKFLQGSKTMKTIENFENSTKIKLAALVKKILIDEQVMSWPQFLNLLRVSQTPQIQIKFQKMQKDLHTLAQYHWKTYSYETKKQYIKLKFISQKIDQTLNEKDVDFFLMRLTKTPLYLLMKEHSFIGILEKSGKFDKFSHQLWINFINIIPLGNINNINKLPQQNQFQMGQQVNSRNQGPVFKSKTKIEKTQYTTLFDNKGCVNFKFIMNLANKKLTNVIYDSSKKMFVQHQQLKSLNKMHDALR